MVYHFHKHFEKFVSSFKIPWPLNLLASPDLAHFTCVVNYSGRSLPCTQPDSTEAHFQLFLSALFPGDLALILLSLEVGLPGS